MQNIAVVKEYNIRRHYNSKHASKYDKFSGKLREEKLKQLQKSLQNQQSVFTQFHQTGNAVVKASYRIAQQIAMSSKTFSEGSFVKTCMLIAAEEICPEKRRDFASISLSRNTVVDRICDLSENVQQQLSEKVAHFVAYSVAIDESTDVRDTAQLAIFIRGVDSDVKIIEELVEVVPMRGTTKADDIFTKLVDALDKLGVDWTKLVSLATDGAPQMVGRRAGVASLLKNKVLSINPNQQISCIHCIIHQEVLCSKVLKMNHVMDVVVGTVNFIRARGLNHRQFNKLLDETDAPGLPYHTEVRWLSRGLVLKRFYELRSTIHDFMLEKGRDVKELKNSEWVQDLAFMVDITDHLQFLNKQLQGRNKIVTELYDAIRAFKLKLQLFENQLAAGNTFHFSALKTLQDKDDCIETEKYCHNIKALANAFGERFADFQALESDFAIFSNPFSVNAEEVPPKYQMELIDLKFNNVLKDKFANVGIKTFYQYVGSTYPNLKELASKIMSMFGSTYACEQLFSLMNLNKSRFRSQLTDSHLNATLKVATAQTLVPDINMLTNAKRCQVSSSHSAVNKE